MRVENIRKILDIGFAAHSLRRWKADFFRSYDLYAAQKKNPSCHFEGRVLVVNGEQLKLGSNVLIKDGVQLHCGDGEGSISIGDDSTISEGSVCYGQGHIEVGANVSTGPGVMLLSMREDYSRRYAEESIAERHRVLGKVSVGAHSILYSAVIVAPGVTIGEGAIVGANSLVLHDVEPWTVVAGSPARFIKPRT